MKIKNPLQWIFEAILSLLLYPVWLLWRRHERAVLFHVGESGKQAVYYCVIPNEHGGFIGMAKTEPFTSAQPNPVTEPGDLWFEFGASSAQAFWKITDEMIRLGLEKDVILCDGGRP